MFCDFKREGNNGGGKVGHKLSVTNIFRADEWGRVKVFSTSVNTHKRFTKHHS